MRKWIKRIYAIANRVSEDDVFVYSAQGSFYIIIASIPFIMLLLSLAQHVIPASVKDVLFTLEAMLPAGLKNYASGFIDELFIKSSSSVISITALTSVWSASRGFAAVERGIKRVYHTPDRENLFINIGVSILYTIAFAVVLIGTLVLLVFGESIYQFLKGKYRFFAAVFESTRWARPVIYFIAVCLFFALVYKTFSGKKMPYKRHLPGAVFTTAGWMVFSFLFSIYIENFANYSYIYGSLTAIVLMMLWLYSCMIILLFGAELNMLNQIYKERKQKKWEN